VEPARSDCVIVGGRELAALDGGFEQVQCPLPGNVGRGRIALDQCHRQAGEESRCRNAGTHQPAADDTQLHNGQRLSVSLGDLRDLTLGKEHIALRASLGRIAQFREDLGFPCHARSEARIGGLAEKIEGAQRADLPARFLGKLFPRRGKGTGQCCGWRVL
jgi:hypothetical protein